MMGWQLVSVLKTIIPNHAINSHLLGGYLSLPVQGGVIWCST